MKNKHTGGEIDIIINKINSLYPDFNIQGITLTDEGYLIIIEYDSRKPGTGSNQVWKIENNKAVFIGSVPKR